MAVVWEWAVLIERASGNPLVPLQTVTWYGESEAEVREDLQGCGELKSLKALKPMIDWSKPSFSAQEGCLYIGLSDSGEGIAELQARGEFPKPVNGRTKGIPKWLLESYIYKRVGMSPPGVAA